MELRNWRAFTDYEVVHKGLNFAYNEFKNKFDKKELTRYSRTHTVDNRFTVQIISTALQNNGVGICKYKNKLYFYRYDKLKKDFKLLEIDIIKYI
ncbi:hypothetical protein [Clostridium ljungdahlii]|uniref:Uncharacterized protein n=1 Tax=Clostridium ljungdahlii TaxID=1538 RepID=A0A166RKM9_9CLOT|nr:hypothetical protein [Clostridium ljungdahlii]OAA90874.1 hypothetical protein WY13_00940 [Clostridium ljungdahlii]